MTPLTWLAIGIGAPVAYAAMAGLTWKAFKLDGRPHERYWHSCGIKHMCPGCGDENNRLAACVFWPGYWLFKGAALVFLVLTAPLRATFRLTSGQTMRKHGER